MPRFRLCVSLGSLLHFAQFVVDDLDRLVRGDANNFGERLEWGCFNEFVNGGHGGYRGVACGGCLLVVAVCEFKLVNFLY